MEIVNTNVDAYNYIKKLCQSGYRQDIQRGSFEQEKVYRMQAYPLSVEITDPFNFLYLPKEITIGMIENYYKDYIIGDEEKENEDYSYWERMKDQIPKVFEIIKNTPSTNQAVISISQPSDIDLKYPPCLREICFSFFENKLNMTSYWRSNDINEAFLLNQGGLSYLLKDVCEYAELNIGSHFYFSPGSHIYVY